MKIVYYHYGVPSLGYVTTYPELESKLRTTTLSTNLLEPNLAKYCL